LNLKTRYQGVFRALKVKEFLRKILSMFLNIAYEKGGSVCQTNVGAY